MAAKVRAMGSTITSTSNIFVRAALLEPRQRPPLHRLRMDTLMTTQSPQQDHAYPVDVEFPDLSGYTAGNTGIPYVYTFDSGVAGPHVMINALTHGNEVCGAITVKAL